MVGIKRCKEETIMQIIRVLLLLLSLSVGLFGI